MQAVAPPSLESAAARLAVLLTGSGELLSDPNEGGLEFEPVVAPRPLVRGRVPAETWAVDGGQALVADARCVQLLVTRAARVRFTGRECALEEEGALGAHLLGGGGPRLDANLLRDRGEWQAVEQCITEAAPGALVLVDGDLVPDWRIPSSYLGGLLARADDHGVLLAGVTKHSSLARGGAPLLGRLELEAAAVLGPRATWWAPVATIRPDVAPGALQVVAARLDPDARFAFRIDLPGSVEPEAALGALSALSDDAAFPGYPYPLTVADRLAACPPWVRQEVRFRLDELFDLAGVPFDVRERAFADRHAFMERA